MFNIRQPYPLLLAARRTLDDAGFTRILRACSMVSFRYNVIGNMGTDEQERVYNSVAVKIANQKLTNVADIIRALHPIYLADEQFRGAFSEKQIRTSARNRKVMRYILFEIERHIANLAFDTTSDKYTLEHILPEHPNENFPTFTDEQVDQCVYRIGNLTLLEATDNRDIGNKPYKEKRSIFEQSGFELTKRVASEHHEWTPERVVTRQAFLANQATAIWRLAELS
jgi:hypothetical protein